MKKSLLALAALTAFAGVASAQSSVTVFGGIDLAARNVKNGPAGSLKTLSTDGNYSSRLGFRGVEDLGGGLKAGFWLEAGVGADTGGFGVTSGAATTSGVGAVWNRRATASLMGDFGEIRLGRDYTPTFWNHTQFDPFGTNGVGNANNLIGTGATSSGSATTRILGVPSGAAGDSRTGTHVRADNSIGYHLPSLGGLYGQVMVAAGEGAVGNKYTGARLGYAAGPVNVAVAFGKTDLVVDSLKAFNVAGSYNLGFATVFVVYHNYKVGSSEPGSVGAVAAGSSWGVPGNRDLKNYLLGTTVPLGQGTFKFSFAKTKGDLNSGNAAFNGTAGSGAPTRLDASATQIALGYVYDMSKRTSLYTHYSTIKNKKGAHFYASGSGPAYANTTADFTSSGYEFGIKHTF
jgi:predicted porin